VTQYRTKQGDILDAICCQFYGRESAMIDVFEANPGLADKGPVFAAAIIINLPPLTAPVTPSNTVRLWD